MSRGKRGDRQTVENRRQKISHFNIVGATARVGADSTLNAVPRKGWVYVRKLRYDTIVDGVQENLKHSWPQTNYTVKETPKHVGKKSKTIFQVGCRH